jgi:hypothetical protein
LKWFPVTRPKAADSFTTQSYSYELTINRQRCCILESGFFEYWKAQAERQAALKRRPAPVSRLDGATVLEKATSRYKRTNIIFHEVKCSAPRCTFCFCETPACMNALSIHQPCIASATRETAAKKLATKAVK